MVFCLYGIVIIINLFICLLPRTKAILHYIIRLLYVWPCNKGSDHLEEHEVLYMMVLSSRLLEMFSSWLTP